MRTDDRFAGLQIVFNRLPLVVRQLEEAREKDRDVRVRQRPDAGQDVFRFLLRIPLAPHHGGAKTKTLQLLREERQRKFRRIV